MPARRFTIYTAAQRVFIFRYPHKKRRAGNSRAFFKIKKRFTQGVFVRSYIAENNRRGRFPRRLCFSVYLSIVRLFAGYAARFVLGYFAFSRIARFFCRVTTPFRGRRRGSFRKCPPLPPPVYRDSLFSEWRQAAYRFFCTGNRVRKCCGRCLFDE